MNIYFNYNLCNYYFSPNSDLVTVLKRMLGFYIKRSMYLPMKLTLQSLVDLCISEYIKPEALLKIINENICDIHHPSVISRYSCINIIIVVLINNK